MTEEKIERETDSRPFQADYPDIPEEFSLLFALDCWVNYQSDTASEVQIDYFTLNVDSQVVVWLMKLLITPIQNKKLY